MRLLGRLGSKGATASDKSPERAGSGSRFAELGAIKLLQALGGSRGEDSKGSRQSSESAVKSRSDHVPTEGGAKKLIDATGGFRSEDSKDSKQSGGNVVKAGRGPAFEISVSRIAGEDLGIEVNMGKNKGFLYLAALNPGAFEDWNKANPDQRGIKVGDFIMQVNGARTSEEMCVELLHASDLVMSIRPGAD